jgi:adenosine kinase
LAATYAIEYHGTQEHSYTPEEFVARFDREFPDFAGSVDVDSLRPKATSDSAV